MDQTVLDKNSSTANAVTVSLVIPAYNEESHIAACLDAVAAQTVQPFEVIVVDNNSADQTAAIARRYPFVTVVSEARQGVPYARDAGFNAAHGDVIGRIDVDTWLSADWVEQVQRLMVPERGLDAVSGSIGFYDVPFAPVFNRVELACRSYVARGLARRDEMFLYGGNMAIRRTAWQAVRGEVCHERSFHEDIDLGAHLAHRGQLIQFEPSLYVQISARRIDSPANDYYPYVLANTRTYAAHGLRGRLYMYPVELLVGLAYPFLRMLYRSYNPYTGKVSFGHFYRQSIARVSPVAETP